MHLSTMKQIIPQPQPASHAARALLLQEIMALGGRGCFRQAEYVDQLRRMSTEQLCRELAAVATEQWSVTE